MLWLSRTPVMWYEHSLCPYFLKGIISSCLLTYFPKFIYCQFKIVLQLTTILQMQWYRYFIRLKCHHFKFDLRSISRMGHNFCNTKNRKKCNATYDTMDPWASQRRLSFLLSIILKGSQQNIADRKCSVHTRAFFLCFSKTSMALSPMDVQTNQMFEYCIVDVMW